MMKLVELMNNYKMNIKEIIAIFIWNIKLSY